MIPRRPQPPPPTAAAVHRPGQPLPGALEPDAASLQFSAIRAQGPGGQNVNKVSNAVQLRFDIGASQLPEVVKARLLASGDSRIAQQDAGGVIVIKAQNHRSLQRNQADALDRLRALIARAAHVPTPRRATRPTAGSKRRRLDAKQQRGAIKALRGKVGGE